MFPYQRDGEEGVSYKEYAYSPVPPSSTSAVVNDSELNVDPPQNLELNERARVNCINGNTREMTEEGSRVLQYVAAASANLCIVATGAMLAWTSPVLPKLQSMTADSPLDHKISVEESSWIGSFTPLGAVFGSFLAGYSAEKWGRKKTLLASTVWFTLGWILVATAASVEQLYAARFLFGIALSFPFTAVPMYCGEIAETSIRGALGSFLQLFITIGLLLSYAIGTRVTYTVFWIICASYPIIFFIVFMFMPESPYYLVTRGRREEAIESLAKLRRKSPAGVQKELDEIQASVDEAFATETKISDLFTVKSNFKALLLTCALASFQQLTGVNVVLFYMEEIFLAAKIDPAATGATVIVGSVQVVASMVTPIVVDRLGRRLLLIISGVGAALPLAALGLFFYLQKHQPEDVEAISWLPIAALVVFISLYSIGWGPLPWTVMGEMFASNVKSKASGITVSACWFLAFLITKYAPTLQVSVGQDITFWGFCAFTVLSVVFTILLLPETKGKSLREIQDELNGVKTSEVELNGCESGMKK